MSKVLETKDKLNMFANGSVKTVVIKNVLPSIAAMGVGQGVQPIYYCFLLFLYQ